MIGYRRTMTQLNAGSGPQPDPMGGHTVPRYFGGSTAGHSQAQFGGPSPASRPATTAFGCLTIALFVVGAMLLIGPFGLFVLGGGGNTDRFMEQMSGSFITGAVLIVIAIVVLLFAGRANRSNTSVPGPR